jgi:hypothetical protein
LGRRELGAHVVPQPPNVGRAHAVALQWGPWQRVLTVTLDDQGVVLTTGKARDGDDVGIACHIYSDLPVYVRCGAGAVADGSVVVDISSGWTRLTN